VTNAHKQINDSTHGRVRRCLRQIW